MSGDGWRCNRCGSSSWVGWRASLAPAPRKAQCVPCGHVQELPTGNDLIDGQQVEALNVQEMGI